MKIKEPVIDGELFGITLKEYNNRRLSVAKHMSENSVAILPGSILQYRNHDAEYLFRQNSDFFYLTGFTEPNAVLVIIKEKNKEKNEEQNKEQNEEIQSILFTQPLVEEEMIWTGPRLGMEGAIRELGMDKAYSIIELDEVMPKLLANKQHIHYSYGRDFNWDKRLNDWLTVVRSQSRKGVHCPTITIDLLTTIHSLRIKKSPAEIALLKQAALISANAHSRIMKYCKPSLMEYQLEAEFIHECSYNGCRAQAYTPIVGGGENACILHYVQNNKSLKEGDLVLIDAGGEFQYYAADITRTYPVNGRFTLKQKQLYNVVLKAQVRAIEKVRPGIHWNQLQEEIISVLVPGLVEIGILKGSVSTLINEKTYHSVYMHGSGHWLGLDVHDAGDYKINEEWRVLEPGMVLTIEPGVYIAPHHPTVNQEWWGMGIRIEDDILVTETGCEVLSEAAPKTIEAIEALMHTSK